MDKPVSSVAVSGLTRIGHMRAAQSQIVAGTQTLTTLVAELLEESLTKQESIEELEAKAHPPQGVVVPVEVIKQAIKILDTHIAYTINALGWGAVPVVRDTRIALADAIKEGDTP